MSLIPPISLSPERQQQILEELLRGKDAPAIDQKIETIYNPVIFEPRAFYDGNDKQLFTYDKSLERLQAAGHKRQPRPAEVFSFLIANLEGKLSSAQKAVADDMLNSYGEWLSAAAERHSDTLTVYIDPKGLVWDGSAYVKQNFSFGSKRDFSVAGIPSQRYIDLKKFGPDFVEFMYTRSFAQLPQEMREGGKRAQVYLPPDGLIRPVGRGNGWFGIGGVYGFRASRGCSPVVAKNEH